MRVWCFNSTYEVISFGDNSHRQSVSETLYRLQLWNARQFQYFLLTEMNSGLNFYYFAFLLRLLPFVVIAECGSIPEVLSVTRSSDEGDSFALKASSSASCQSVCEQRDAVSSSTRATVQGTAICPCQCGQPQKPTFFVTKSGRQSCGSDRDVLVKINGGKTNVEFHRYVLL